MPPAPRGKALPVEKDAAAIADATDLCGIKSKWMDVTPEMARDWLQNNFRNRPVSEETVTAYARDMKNKRWVPTHQGIAFNTRDELIDGQHRLYGIIKADCTVRMMVTFGLPSKIKGFDLTVMDCVDRGRTRSVADQLKIQHGMVDGTVIAAICATIGSLCFGQRTKRLSVDQTLVIYRAFEGPINTVINLRSKEHGLKMTGVLAAFAFAGAALGDDDERVMEMFEQLNVCDGVKHCLAEGSPLYLLRAFLTSDDARLLNRTTDRALVEFVLQVIWQQLSGIEQLDQLTPGLDGFHHFRNLQSERAATVAALFQLP